MCDSVYSVQCFNVWQCVQCTVLQCVTVCTVYTASMCDIVYSVQCFNVWQCVQCTVLQCVTVCTVYSTSMCDNVYSVQCSSVWQHVHCNTVHTQCYPQQFVLWCAYTYCTWHYPHTPPLAALAVSTLCSVQEQWYWLRCTATTLWSHTFPSVLSWCRARTSLCWPLTRFQRTTSSLWSHQRGVSSSDGHHISLWLCVLCVCKHIRSKWSGVFPCIHQSFIYHRIPSFIILCHQPASFFYLSLSYSCINHVFLSSTISFHNPSFYSIIHHLFYPPSSHSTIHHIFSPSIISLYPN